jgi:lysophospholipase L1-like esterase
VKRRQSSDGAARHVLVGLVALALPTLLACFLVAELVLRVIVPAAQFPTVAFDARDRVLKYDVTAQRSGVNTLGPFAQPRATWRINDAGWNSDIEYPTSRAPGRRLVAIIGDSFIEGMQVEPTQNVGSVLRRTSRNAYDVYTFGISGAPLSQYLMMARYAVRTFHPDVLVINVVHNDFDESVRSLQPKPMFLQVVPSGNGMHEVTPHAYTPDPLRRLLRRSAVFRYLAFNLAVGSLPSRVRAALRVGRGTQRFNSNTDPAALRRNAPIIRRAVATIVHTLRTENPATRIVIMMDAPRRDIYAGTLATSDLAWLTTLMRETATAERCDFLDLTPVFAEYWAREHRSLNFAQDFHWNATGHRLVAEALDSVLAGR